MKKVILALLLLGGTAAAHAQFTGGIKAGANISNFTGSTIENVDKQALVGFHAGGYLNFRLGLVSIQPELLVSTAGAKYESATESENFRLTYITLPVMARVHLGGLYLEGGPQVGFKISEDIGESTINDFAKDLDLSAGLGAGFQLGRIGIGGRYLVGLSKVGDFDADADQDPDFKNSVIQLGLSIRL